jgi:hypothetical protein
MPIQSMDDEAALQPELKRYSFLASRLLKLMFRFAAERSRRAADWLFKRLDLDLAAGVILACDIEADRPVLIPVLAR